MLLLLLACGSEADNDTQVMERPVDSGNIQDTETAAPEDVDEDGFTTETDCDDWNPLIYPGAIEVADDKDNDCDGHIDWDGVFQGTVDMTATAIYEGAPYSFAQSCTLVVDRIWRNAAIDVVCQVDLSQPMADLLLGETLTISANGNGIVARSWMDDVELESTGGDFSWDANGEMGLTWSELETDGGRNISALFQMDTHSLDMQFSGVAERL